MARYVPFSGREPVEIFALDGRAPLLCLRRSEQLWKPRRQTATSLQTNQPAEMLLVHEGGFADAQKDRRGRVPVDKIKPLLTATATAQSGRNGHAQSSDGILDFVAKQHKTAAAKFRVRKTLTAILVFLSLSAWAIAQGTGSIRGTVSDSSGARIFGAVVAVEGADGSRNMTVTDDEGAFKISSLAPGNYSVRISAAGMSDWSDVNVPASATPERNPVLAVLQVAPEVTTVTVRLSTEELAAEQINQQLKQ
jgi:hypothetical protein